MVGYSFFSPELILGSGNSGNVWLAYVHDRELGIRSVYAAKKIRHENDFREGNTGRGSSELESLKNELEIYIRLQCHPNFPKLIGVVRDDRHFTIITEYVEGGDLRSFLRQKAAQTGMFVQQPVTDADYHENMTFKRNESQVRWLMRFDKPHAVGAVTTSILVYIALQIALTLKRLVMDLKILHRDAAARNVLITRDFVVKITDFGLARDLSYDKESQRDLPITALAPETLKTQKFTAQSEVWQFGVLLFEIFSLGMVEPYDDILAKSTTQRPAVKLQLYLQRGGRLSPPREMPEPM
uniref:Protein kinase domain-containing protein n=1 Tax=Plectus sambesii TaxID=2011161 RepID=A0A914WQW5_9BILA